jgi:hypothetical protein
MIHKGIFDGSSALICAARHKVNAIARLCGTAANVASELGALI